MNRRRILTGLVAAPFVARLGLLMPVRPVLASGVIVDFKWWLLPAYSTPVSYGIVLDTGGVISRGTELDWCGPGLTGIWPDDHPEVLVQR